MSKRINIKTIRDLITKSSRTTKVVNLVTSYRIIMSPILFILLLGGNEMIFKWLLLASFTTDAIDGYLARKYKVNSILGAKLDSLGDDLTVLIAIIGLFILRFDFIKEHFLTLIVLVSLYLLQLIASIIRYRKMSSFHTYSAKIAAIMQGIFLLSVFFFKEPNLYLFYFATIATAIDLVEETIIVFMLPKWKNDVKGIYWLLKAKRSLLLEGRNYFY